MAFHSAASSQPSTVASTHHRAPRNTKEGTALDSRLVACKQLSSQHETWTYCDLSYYASSSLQRIHPDAPGLAINAMTTQ